MKVNYFIPKILLDILRIIRAIFIYINYRKILIKNKKVKNNKLGNAVFIIANGPSLNDFDHSELKNKDVIVMNNFDLCAWKDEPNIVAHCIGEPIDSDHWGADQIEISNNTNAESYWYHYSVNNQVKNYANIYHTAPFYFIAPVFPENLFLYKKFNLSSITLGYSTTAQMAIMVAMYMGYKQINLVGFDHDMLKNRNISPHFYKEGDTARIVDKTSDSYLSIMNKCVKMWKRYYKIKEVADLNNVCITNKTKNSFLDVF
jgi:uncharacterized Rossmann fold enzyme